MRITSFHYLSVLVLSCVIASPVVAQSLAETGMATGVAGTLAAAPTAPVATPPAVAAAATPNTASATAPAIAAPLSADPTKNIKVNTPEPPAITTAIEGETEPKLESIFFTGNQLISIIRANQGFIAPKEAYDPNAVADGASEQPVDPGPRILKLTGIVYHGARDWTIWLNDQRVTPRNIPDRIMGMTVRNDRVMIRWMDLGTQRIVNVLLRPNQQYLLDSDTFETAR